MRVRERKLGSKSTGEKVGDRNVGSQNVSVRHIKSNSCGKKLKIWSQELKVN